VNRTPSGRDRERDHLLTQLTRVRSGQGSVVLIEGEGGSGKSTLARTLLDEAHAGGLPVVHGASWELSGAVPYESLVAAVSRYLRSLPIDDVRRLTSGLPTLGALIEWLDLHPPVTAPEAFKVRAQDAFATLIARIGGEQPVVIALDDLHWADQASLEVLQYLCLDLPDSPLLLLFTVRPDDADRRPEVRQFLATLRRTPWTSTIRLGRLDRSAIDAVVTDRLGGNVTPRVCETIATRSGGTPLLIHELLDDLVESGAIVQRAGVWELRDAEVPLTRSAADLIRSRLDRVEAHDRAVLEALAVINGPTNPDVVSSLLGVPVDAVEGSLERLRAIRLAIETDRDQAPRSVASWTVEHPIVAEVVEAELVDAARRRLHRRVLEVDVLAPLGRRARHALLAGDSTDRIGTITLLADAGTEALVRATPSAAIEPLRGAFSMLEESDDPTLRHRVRRDLGIAHLRQLEVGPALVHLRGAWDQAQRDGDAAACVDLLLPLDNAEFRAGNGGVSGRELEGLRAVIAARQEWDLLVELSWVHVSHAGRGQSPAELENARVALAMIPSSSTPPRLEALHELLAVYSDVGTLRDPVGERVERFLAAADRWSEHHEVAHRNLLLAFDAATLSGDPALTARCQERHRRMEQETGEPPTWRLPMFEGFRSLAEGRIEERPADLRLYGAAPRSAGLDVLMQAMALRYTSGPTAAMEFLRATDESSEDVSAAAIADRTARLYRAYGAMLLAIGTPTEPEAAAAALVEVGGDNVLAPVAGFVFGGAAALAQGLAGDADAQAAAVDQLELAGSGRWLPSAWACLLRSRHAEETADRVGELVRAAEILDGLGRRLEAAERVIDAAEIDVERCGEERLTSALDTAQDVGASWLVARALAVRPLSSASPGAAGPAGPLTSREMEVAELVSEGLTNREIAGRLYISIRTVTSHLDHIYTKLGLSSRVALVDWYRSRAGR
jgi:DNA-binding CsgD family transcriptional regulator